MTIDLLRQGLRVTEVEVDLAHRATGTRPARPAAPRSPAHRRRQGARPAAMTAPTGENPGTEPAARTLIRRAHPPVLASCGLCRTPIWDPREPSPRRRCSPSTPEPRRCPARPSRPPSTRCATARPSGPSCPSRARWRASVTATLDDLAAGNDLVIVAEVPLPVAFALLARPGTATRRRQDGGRPPAGACRSAGSWLAANLPDAELGPARVQRRGGPPGRGRAARRGAGRRVRRGHGTASRCSSPDVHDRANAVTRFVVVRRPGPLPARTGSDRTSLVAFLAEDHPGRADGDPHRVRGARHQPDHDPVPADRRRARPVLLLHRLRGARRRRPGRRGADGPAPGLRGRPVPGQLRPAATAAPPRSGAAPPTRSSPRPPPGWAGCATAGP